jgi:iron complex outermembrane receptor protein
MTERKTIKPWTPGACAALLALAFACAICARAQESAEPAALSAALPAADSAAAQPAPVVIPPAKDSAIPLEKQVVKARRASRSAFAAKLPMDRIENPQVYNTVDAKTMKDQVVVRYDEALRNVPGLDKLWEPTGRASGDGAAYYTMRGFDAQPNFTNGLPGLTLGSLDPANLERIEVLKGPSGTLFGSSNVTYGGLINNVTKLPGQGYFGEAGLTIGSFGLTRLTADANLPLSGEKDVTLRVITAAHSENSFQDAGFRKSLFLAPTLAYQANHRLSFMVGAEYQANEGTNAPMLFLNRSRTVDWKDLEELNYDRKLSLTSNDLSIRNPHLNLQSRMEYRVADGWTSQSIVSRGNAQSDGYYSYLWNEDPRTFGLFVSDQQGEIVSTNVQQNFIGEFNLGPVRNRLLLGVDYFDRTSYDYSSGWAWVHDVDARGNIDYVDPYSRDSLPARPLTRQTVDSLLASRTPSHSKTFNKTFGLYLSEVMVIAPAISATASLRLDRFDNEGELSTEDDDYDQLALSPRVGLVYQPILHRLSLFGSYLNGFRNIAPSTVSDSDGSNPRTKTFKPEHADQFEAGAKADFMDGRVSATISGYYIRVADIVIGDAANPNNSIQGGEVESRGVELDLNASPMEGLSLIGGYSYNDIEVIRAGEGDIWSVPGRRPVGAGPEQMANAWAKYRIGYGVLKGLGFGAGVNVFSELLIMNSPLTGVFSLPGAAVYNATLSYTTGGGTLSLAVNNLTDEEYYKGYSTVNPQPPRNVTADFTYGF